MQTNRWKTAWDMFAMRKRSGKVVFVVEFVSLILYTLLAFRYAVLHPVFLWLIVLCLLVRISIKRGTVAAFVMEQVFDTFLVVLSLLYAVNDTKYLWMIALCLLMTALTAGLDFRRCWKESGGELTA